MKEAIGKNRVAELFAWLQFPLILKQKSGTGLVCVIIDEKRKEVTVVNDPIVAPVVFCCLNVFIYYNLAWLEPEIFQWFIAVYAN